MSSENRKSRRDELAEIFATAILFGGAAGSSTMGLLMFAGRSTGAPEMVSLVVGIFSSLAYVTAKLSKQDGPPGPKWP